MFFEESFPFSKTKDSLEGFQMQFKERFRIPSEVRGDVWAVLKHSDGSEERIDIGKNLVIADASIMVARILKDKNEITWGLKYLAVGTGDPTWPVNPPAPTGSEHGLVAELERKTFSSTNFIDPTTGAVTTTPTNIVDYVTIFDQNEAVGGLKEMGLVGADAIATPVAFANGGKNTDTFFNIRRFPVINKPATSVCTFTWRITT